MQKAAKLLHLPTHEPHGTIQKILNALSVIGWMYVGDTMAPIIGQGANRGHPFLQVNIDFHKFTSRSKDTFAFFLSFINS